MVVTKNTTLSVLLCALTFLWTMETVYGYTSPYVHGGKPGISGKRDRISSEPPMNLRQLCMTARLLGCEYTNREEEKMLEV